MDLGGGERGKGGGLGVGKRRIWGWLCVLGVIAGLGGQGEDSPHMVHLHGGPRNPVAWPTPLSACEIPGTAAGIAIPSPAYKGP